MPTVHESTYVAKTAVLIGDITIGKHCGIFPYAVLRGDENTIIIEDGSNVQDCCVIHVDKKHAVHIGKNVSIGHGAIVHGATIHDDCLIGIHATVLNGADVGEGSVIGANALVTTDMKIPENSLVLGIPGKIIKQDTTFRLTNRSNAETYQHLAKNHKQGKYPIYLLE